jgi:hypothetical protein
VQHLLAWRLEPEYDVENCSIIIGNCTYFVESRKTTWIKFVNVPIASLASCVINLDLDLETVSGFKLGKR